MNNLVLVLLIFVLNLILNVVMNLLGIKSETYFNYLLWFDLLFVFYLVLPNKVGRIF